MTKPVPYGPLAYRRGIVRRGPWVALLPALVLIGLMVLARLVLTCPPQGACSTRVVTSWLLPALALPTAVLFGLPMEADLARVIAVGVSSTLIWLLIGRIAARRATRQPIATWRDYVREFAWLAVAVWLGIATGSALIGLGVGQLGDVLG